MREMKKRKLKIYFVPISWYGLQSEMQCCKRFHKIAENDSKPALKFIQKYKLDFYKKLPYYKHFHKVGKNDFLSNCTKFCQ